MNMFGFGGYSVKKFESRYLNTKETGMTIEDFEGQFLRNVVHTYYKVQDETAYSFVSFQQEAVDKADTPEGEEAMLSAGFLVGINDGIHNPDIEFAIVEDLKRKQMQGWGFLIGDPNGDAISAVECLNDYAKARKLTPQQVSEKFPRSEFEQEFAKYEQEHSFEGA